MTRVTKGWCLYKNSDPKGLSAPAPGLYTCINTWKIMYKIRLQIYFFETCNKWAKWQGFSVDIRILSPRGFLPLPRVTCPFLKSNGTWPKAPRLHYFSGMDKLLGLSPIHNSLIVVTWFVKDFYDKGGNSPLKFKWQSFIFLFLHYSFKGLISRIILQKTACKNSN